MARMVAYTLMLWLIFSSAASKALTADELITRVQRTYQAKRDITVRFKQVITKPATGRQIKSRGRILYQHPNRFLWHQQRPDVVKYISDGKTLWHVQPTQNSAEKLMLKRTRLFATLRLFFGKGDLKKDHQVSLGRVEQGPTLVLVPKVKNLYKELTLVIDLRTNTIIETRMVDPGDNRFRAIYSKIDFSPIASSSFAFKPDPGMNVRDLSKPRPRPKTP